MSYVLLEDGARFDGEAVGAPGPVTGEVVFNTGMSGYQESMTDPSYARQLITFTYPHIGNYGVSAAAMESERIHARGAIMRAARNNADHAGAEGGWLDWLREAGVPAITGVDTRALVLHIREAGSMRGGIFPADCDPREAAAMIEAGPSMVNLDLAREVTPERPFDLEAAGGVAAGPTVALIDWVDVLIVAMTSPGKPRPVSTARTSWLSGDMATDWTSPVPFAGWLVGIVLTTLWVVRLTTVIPPPDPAFAT